MCKAKNNPQPLLAHTLPLFGRHLIEASAGTGKTFNITRIYLRMLLERKVSVENILVMTFTKAATEEIRGRIDDFLRESLANWREYTADPNNEFFFHLGRNVTFEQANVLIKHALLNLDEAAIFTIHGFCKRVLTQQAFASGMSFSAQMEADDADIILEAVQDFYRVLAKSADLAQYECLIDSWPTPPDFINSFMFLLRTEKKAKTLSKQSLNQRLKQLAIESIKSLQNSEDIILNELVNNKKDKQIRFAEFEQLLHFLKQLEKIDIELEINVSELKDITPDFKFVSPGRFPRAAAKADVKTLLIEICEPVNHLKTLFNDYSKLVSKAKSNTLVLGAIEIIKNSIEQKKIQANIINFDDLISHLANALNTQSHTNRSEAERLTSALVKQFPVALIDEFQDTDPKQFAILEQLYFNSNTHSLSHTVANDNLLGRALYLIGDPKQAIYGFRGGDIFTYLQASKQVDQQWLMDTNWRSSTGMINGYNHLFYGNALADNSKQVFGRSIDYIPVFPSPFANNTVLIDDSNFTALQFIDFNADDEYSGRGGHIKKEFQGVMAAWCASEICRLLARVSLLGKTDVSSPIQANDIAVLVRNGSEAQTIKSALADVGVASVYKSQRSNLFTSSIAQEFVHVLNAVINRDDDRAFIAALSGPFFGKDSQQLYNVLQDEIEWENTRLTFNQFYQLWQRRGFMAMALKILHNHYPGGNQENERQLTNIIHLFELLQTASQKLKQPQELMAYLQQQCANPAQNEAELRLESDANLVQIVTLHGSKGLEYPVVFAPFVSLHKDPTRFSNKTKEVIDFHGQDGQVELRLGTDDDALKAMALERYAEDVRLLYVAVTRAKLRCYLGCAKFSGYHLSPLGQCLQMSEKQCFTDALQVLLENSSGDIAVHQVDGQLFDYTPVEHEKAVEVPSVAKFKGKIERDWWLSSFSALTRNVRHEGKAEPDRDIEIDLTTLAESKQLRFALTKGARTGNFLHDLLQYCDFTKPNWHEQLAKMLPKFGELPSGFTRQDLIDWLDQILATNLDGKDLSLDALPFDATLREAEFYFPMQQVKINQLNHILSDFRCSIGAEHTTEKLSSFGELKGMMHGFIDLIFCHEGKYYVCDYKSSHLGNQFTAYQSEKLTSHICGNYYDLQFLIYSLALHRYLAIRLDNYNVEQHFGGVYYLYLRGMSVNKSDLEQPVTGVFYQSLSPLLLNQLDATFKGESVDFDKVRHEQNISHPINTQAQGELF